MGQRHELAGQYGKRNARARWRRGWFALGVVTIVGYGGMCFAFGFFWSRFGAWAAVGVSLLAAAVAFWGVEPWLDRHLYRLAKERIKHLRGGQAEALIAWILERELEDDWHIFNGIQLIDDSDHDHVVVGPGGVFCVSTKSQRGLFVGTDAGEGLLWNNEPSAFARQAMSQALRLRERLASLLGADVPFVQPVLAAALGFTQGDALGGKVWLVHADSITDRLAPERGPRRLNGEGLARVVRAVTMLQDKAASVYRRPAATATR